MTNQELTSAPVATNVTVQFSNDNQFVAMTFATKNMPVNITFPKANLGDMITRLINVAEKEATEKVTRLPNGEISTIPISVAALGISRGRNDSEALLSIRTGPMTLTFSVDLSALLGTCEKLQRMTTKIPGPKTAH